MQRTVLAMLVLVGLVAANAARLDIRTDAGAVLGTGTVGARALESTAGRGFTIALVDSDVERRSRIARELSTMLAESPLIGRAAAAPTAPHAEALDWLWLHRLRLAAPEPLTVPAMTARLEHAVESLTRAEGMVLGDRLLRDPTGSFAGLLDRLRALRPALPLERGVWQARNGSAALVFGEFADRPFDAEATRALADGIVETAGGARALVIGPRFVTARINAEIARAAAIAAIAATLLALGWLVWRLGARRVMLGAILPVAIAAAAGVLVTQTVFGSVHVIALGFGGCLVGLGLDYPLHLLAHPDRARARRLVLIGAGTTAVAFLALLGTGLDVLAQTGLFVATGLMAAAIASLWLSSGAEAPLAAGPAPGLRSRYSWIPPLVVVAVSAGVLAFRPAGPPAPVFAPPDWLEKDLAELRAMVELPSGRYRLTIDGKDEDELLERASNAVSALGADAHATDGFLLPSVRAQSTALAALPVPATFRGLAAEAAARADLRPEFVERLVESYAEALAAPPVRMRDVPAPLAVMLPGIEPTANGLRMIVPLANAADPELLAARIGDAGLAGVRFTDMVADLDARVGALEDAALRALLIGAALAFVILAVSLGAPGRAVRLALLVGAAVTATAAALSLAGPIGAFQIVALTLVAGIGIDYGLFLSLAPDRAGWRSVGLCAVTTLIAFGALAVTPVRILSDIGLTVTLGVILILGLCLIRPKEDAADNAPRG